MQDAGPIVVEATNERVNVMYKSFHGTCQRSEVDLMDFLVCPDPLIHCLVPRGHLI